MHASFSQPLQQSTLSRIALTIAGSDCSGGAGIQADLRTFAAYNVHGMAALTCVVAENPRRVRSIQPMKISAVCDQLACCLESMKPLPVKTGMLYSASIIRACNRVFSSRLGSRISRLVVDPVMISTSGTRLLQVQALRELHGLLETHADLVTPNLAEAEVLAERKIQTQSHMAKAAEEISRRFGCSVLIKGGHLRDPLWAFDYLLHENREAWIRSRRVPGVKTHGTGCCYSAAIVANLALGRSMLNSARNAKRFVRSAIHGSRRLGPWTALNIRMT